MTQESCVAPPIGVEQRLGALPLYLFLITDILNGVTTLAVPGSNFTVVALAVKAIVAIYLAIFCRWTIGALVQVCLVSLSVIWLLSAYGENVDVATLIGKTGSVVLLFIILRQYCERLSVSSLIAFLRVSLFVIAISLVLGFIGVGYDRYADVQGTGLQANGIFVSGNELNIALVGIFWWLAAAKQEHRVLSIHGLTYWLCLVLMVLSQSKTTIIAALITILYFHRLRLTSIVFSLVIVPLSIYLLVSSPIWARWQYFYDINAHEGILSALTDTRFQRVGSVAMNIAGSPLAGGAVLASGGGYLESDPFDLFFNMGVVGAAIYIAFAFALYGACRPKIVPWFLIIFASCFAGHVVYSVFAAPILFCSFYVASRMSVQRNDTLAAAPPVLADTPSFNKIE